jgi:5-methylcytosine-specific restriction endonuclease McrA
VVKYVILAGRVRRTGRAAEIRAELLKEDPCCGKCGTDLVRLACKVLAWDQQYELVSLRAGVIPQRTGGKHHPVTRALALSGFSRKLSQLDHIVPIWAGGDDSAGNLQVLCEPCHQEKTKSEARVRRSLRKRPWFS